MNQLIGKGSLPILILGALLATPIPSMAQKAGQSVSIQYGTVTGAEKVDLKSGAVPKGALVGGTIGLAATSSKMSDSRHARNALLGAAAGGIIAKKAQGSTDGMMYLVKTGSGEIKVVTDQLEIRTGDCVSVEQAGETATIRRVAESQCAQAGPEVVSAPQAATRAESAECTAAKQQMVSAATSQEAELAASKIKLLCH